MNVFIVIFLANSKGYHEKNLSRIWDSLLQTKLNLVKQIKTEKPFPPPPLLPLQPEWGYLFFVPYHLNIIIITEVPQFSFGNDQCQQLQEEADIDLKAFFCFACYKQVEFSFTIPKSCDNSPTFLCGCYRQSMCEHQMPDEISLCIVLLIFVN